MAAAAVFIAASATALAQPRTLVVNVVALDQPYMWNRLGASQPAGMMYALARDVISTNGTAGPLTPGGVMLRADKRPRPFVLRANVGDTLIINFTNLLSTNAVNNGPSTRYAGLHIMGLELKNSIQSGGSWVGANPSGLAGPPGLPSATNQAATSGIGITYTYYAKAEGVFMIYSAAGDGLDQNTVSGLFGSINVQPTTAEWYRSQVTAADLKQATYNSTNLPAGWSISSYGGGSTLNRPGYPATPVLVTNNLVYLSDGHPMINYQAKYPSGLPVLNMINTNSSGQLEIIYSDLTAVITGPNAGAFSTNNPSPSFAPNPASPNRTQPFREASIHYHAGQGVQAFQQFYNPNTATPYKAARDGFAFNYGSAGIGPEVIANRMGVGPMGNPDSVDLKFEEFFLSSWSVGDPAMVVDVPANAPNALVNAPPNSWNEVNTTNMNNELNGIYQPIPPNQKATKVFYPDDPSNVYHSYLHDNMKFRIVNAGIGQTHVHHLHAQQWLHSPNSDDGHYLDSQMIAPGAAYTLEICYGSGNRNLTVGDSIFHCHFYTHFAQGMWALWRTHDVFESGTVLNTNGIPVMGVPNRALPDGEIVAGIPIPALVPLPTIAMAPMPGPVILTNLPPGIGQSRGSSQGRRAVALPSYTTNGTPVYINPGYPFFIPGIAGHRAPHPPLDFAWEMPVQGGVTNYLDGGLPRHLIFDGKIFNEFHTRWDLSKDFVSYTRTNGHKTLADGNLEAFQLPETGTQIENVAMAAHATTNHPSVKPDGTPANFALNGLPPAHGAPLADPAPLGNTNYVTRRYKAAAIQTDVVLNKKGWHYPQQRMLMLWNDVADTVSGNRPPEPFFFRANSQEVIEYWHSNLVPNYYELDDFQVRTPTDILGQHIHLVKFDVLASDGAGNGYNYEDGTLSPEEVQERIFAINQVGGLYNFDTNTQFIGTSQTKLTLEPAPAIFGPPPAGQDWDGAQTTIQRWWADPLLNNEGQDRTLRTVFTHDHFGPSSHQQAGLYAGLLVEPANSTWWMSTTNQQMGTRDDGGPTSWQARIINTTNVALSYREFALEFQDLQLTYSASSPSTIATSPPTVRVFIQPVSRTVVTNLNAGGLNAELFNAFAINGITLSTNTTVTNLRNNNWRLTDPHAPPLTNGAPPDVYNVAGVYDQPNNQWNLSVSIASTMSFTAGWSNHETALNPPTDGGRNANAWPFPSLVSLSSDGTFSANYRSEPVPVRVNTNPGSKTNLTGLQAAQAGDMAYAFSSIPRFDTTLNQQPLNKPIDPSNPGGFKFPKNPLTPGMQPTDPYTPLLRAYANDNIQVRTLVGAHLLPHSFQIQGAKWLYEPGYTNSGYRNVQGMSLSEHFEMQFTLPPLTPGGQSNGFDDYLYITSSEQRGINNGNWGIMRAYNTLTNNLMPLTNNPSPSSISSINYKALATAAGPRVYNVVATTAYEALPGGVIPYNTNNTQLATNGSNGVLFINMADMDTSSTPYTLLPGKNVEPLVLRAAAGEWIQINLVNQLNTNSPAFQQTYGMEPTTIYKNQGSLSARAGLNANLVAYDIAQANGLNIGFNPDQTVGPGATNTTYWYAGSLSINNNTVVQTPMEFGTCNLTAPDLVLQPTFGLFGALIIEPQGATWTNPPDTRAVATVTAGTNTFTEFVVAYQGVVQGDGNIKTINYRTEPADARFTNPITAPLGYSQEFSDSLVGRPPVTPTFVATVGTPVRFRVLHAGEYMGGQVFSVHGHVWQEEPYQTSASGSQLISFNEYSQNLGSQQLATYQPFDIVLPKAGGEAGVTGDYLYHVFLQEKQYGVWGVFRVAPVGAPAAIAAAKPPGAYKTAGHQVSPTQPNPQLFDDSQSLKK